MQRARATLACSEGWKTKIASDWCAMLDNDLEGWLYDNFILDGGMGEPVRHAVAASLLLDGYPARWGKRHAYGLALGGLPHVHHVYGPVVLRVGRPLRKKASRARW